MIKRIVPVALIGATAIGFTACKSNGGFKKTQDGLEYNIVKDEKGDKKPAIGDFVTMHFAARIGDSVLFDSRKMNNNIPVELPLQPGAFKGDMPEGIMMMTAGDSAVFRVSLDSIIKKNGAQRMPWMKDQKTLEYDVVLVSFRSMQQVQEEQKQKSAAQTEVDDKILQEYFAKNNIKPNKTSSGLYYVIRKEGVGEAAKAGQSVTVNYTGKTLDGRSFDSNVDPQFQHVEPFSFALGVGQVIPGWDEGFSLMKKGSKATLYIPSPLAYGPQSPNPAIPANGILMFDVEVTDIKAGGAPQQAMQ